MILYEDITLTDLQTAQSAGLLKTGVIYRIQSGSNNFTAGGEFFEVLCISPTQLANIGTGVFLNSDWQNVGDYADVAALTGFAKSGATVQMWQSLKGNIDYDTLVGTPAVGAVITGGTSGATGILVNDGGTNFALRGLTDEFQSGEVLSGVNPDTTTFTANSTSVVTYTFNPRQGDIVIGWGGAGSNYWGHYQKLNNTTIFVDPVTDAGANYTFLPRDGNKYGYITEVDEITYEVSNDTLLNRTDPHLSVSIDDFNAYGTIPNWTWGYAQNNGNVCKLGFATLDIKSTGQINKNIFSGNNIFSTPIDSNGNIFSNVLSIDAGIFSNFITYPASIDQNFISGVIINNNLSGGTEITGNDINNSSILSGGNNNFSQLNNKNTIANHSHVTLNGFLLNGSLIINERTIVLVSDHTNESIDGSSSSMSAAFDAAANEALGVLTIPVNWGYIGIFKNSTTPANPITQFTGEIPSDHPFTVAPIAGQTFTFTTTTAVLAVAGNIIGSVAGGTTIILTGDRGDFATFKLLPGGVVQLVESVVAL